MRVNKLSILALIFCASVSQAENRYQYRYDLSNPHLPAGSYAPNPAGPISEWASYEPLVSAWVADTAQKCTSWSPDPLSTTESGIFSQTGEGCTANEKRTNQPREINSTSGEIRNVGAQTTETRGSPTGNQTRNYAQSWGGWGTSVSAPFYDCESYAPEASTIQAGQGFNQTATNCSESLTRAGMGYYWDTKIGWVLDPDNPYRLFTQVFKNVSGNNVAIGTKK
ncbi:hypothetical protein RYA05_04055 [Pseudomonas syringae pv. actinidiae]|nr:hypothetical protein [Pseudomonas syringae pv. actinidiae]